MPTAIPPSRRPIAEPQLSRDQLTRDQAARHADVMATLQVCAIGMILLALIITATPSDSTLRLSADDYAAMMLAP
jgi:hypothetical protein